MTPPTHLTPTRLGWRQTWRRDVLATLVVCLLVGLLLTAIRGRNLAGHLIYSFAIGTQISLYIGLLQTAACRWLLRRRPDDPRLLAGWPGLVWMAPAIGVGGLMGYSGGILLGDWLTGRRSSQLWELGFSSALVTGAFVLSISVLVTAYFYTVENARRAQLEAERAQRQAAEAQLTLLQSQLEPHMLFNTLAHLRVLIQLRPDDAQRMLDQLIAFLRATLQASRVESHALRAEFERLRDYLALMQVRMGARLQTELDLPADLMDLPVPPLLLQPLVENAIKHGLEPSIAGGVLRVKARREGGLLRLDITDSGVGLGAAPPSDGTTFGLQQVRDRLRTRYGAAAQLSLQAEPTGGTRAHITIPL
ncbi:sensor histidine kinase [Inhella gelatinilytica]|uniref:Histidine kinase n=1 Tax=Inhella gelatinilytica TaxID=2795030 RepID=A0A931IZU0_9BURK|nr:histidine kinase [Inhella gelatinilytica]MBH9554040.1 histidine kinase [Inhella gelatinilytica]